VATRDECHSYPSLVRLMLREFSFQLVSYLVVRPLKLPFARIPTTNHPLGAYRTQRTSYLIVGWQGKSSNAAGHSNETRPKERQNVGERPF
jgi:hypothetical protein